MDRRFQNSSDQMRIIIMRRIHKLVSNGSRKIQSLIGEQKTARKSSRRVMNELFLEMAPLEERVLMATTIMSSSTNPASIIIDVNGSNTTYSTPAEIANALSKLTDQDSITVDSGVNITIFRLLGQQFGRVAITRLSFIQTIRAW